MTLGACNMSDDTAGAKVKMNAQAEGSVSRLVTALIIVNADDWGRDVDTTDRTLECVREGVVSSVSAMAFMKDSERAADLARQHGIDTGLHLNFTMPFSGPQVTSQLTEHQRKLSSFLNSHQRARLFYHPGLASSFDYVVRAQREEYERLYGDPANRMDGHHHMHLCLNVFLQNLLPKNIIVRRNFTFLEGEIGHLNRYLRGWQDRMLARRHRITDFFCKTDPLYPLRRFDKFLELARHFNVEVETHPINGEEYRFLMDGVLLERASQVAISRGYLLRPVDPSIRVKDIL
jgi:chitin disaccharide deacetylase